MWCVVGGGGGGSGGVCVCIFLGSVCGHVFPFPTSFLLEFRSFLPYPTKRHFTTYVTRGSCGFIKVETRV